MGERGNLPLQACIKRKVRSVLPKGGDLVGVLGTLLGSSGGRLAHIQGIPALGEAGGGLRAAVAAAQGGLELTGLHPTRNHAPGSPPPPPPPPRFSSLAIPRPPSIRPPHHKLFLINENGKLGPHITGCAWQRQQREPLPRAVQPRVRVARAWRGPHPYCSGLVGVQRKPKPLETRAGGFRVCRPRSRCSQRRAASINSLRHLATASGNAARAPPGCGPSCLVAWLRWEESPFGPSGRCEWGIWSLPAWRMSFCPFSSLDCPSPESG